MIWRPESCQEITFDPSGRERGDEQATLHCQVPLLSSFQLMSVWENVMDKSSWQPDIQNFIRGITMEAVTNTQSNNHSDQIPHTKMPKLYQSYILLLFESFSYCYYLNHSCCDLLLVILIRDKGQTFINPTIKLLIVTIGLLIGAYPCVSKLDNDQVQGQPPSLSCHSNHFQHHQITHELTRIFVTRFPCLDVPLSPSLSVFCFSV